MRHPRSTLDCRFVRSVRLNLEFRIFGKEQMHWSTTVGYLGPISDPFNRVISNCLTWMYQPLSIETYRPSQRRFLHQDRFEM